MASGNGTEGELLKSSLHSRIPHFPFSAQEFFDWHALHGLPPLLPPCAFSLFTWGQIHSPSDLHRRNLPPHLTSLHHGVDEIDNRHHICFNALGLAYREVPAASIGLAPFPYHFPQSGGNHRGRLLLPGTKSWAGAEPCAQRALLQSRHGGIAAMGPVEREGVRTCPHSRFRCPPHLSWANPDASEFIW